MIWTACSHCYCQFLLLVSQCGCHLYLAFYSMTSSIFTLEACALYFFLITTTNSNTLICLCTWSIHPNYNEIHTHTLLKWTLERSYCWSEHCLKKWVLRSGLKARREEPWQRAKGREFLICAPRNWGQDHKAGFELYWRRGEKRS